MNSFDEYRKKLLEKYGEPKYVPGGTAGRGAGKVDESHYTQQRAKFDEYRSELKSKYVDNKDAKPLTYHEIMKKYQDFDYYSKIGAQVANPEWDDTFAPLDIAGWKPFGDGKKVENMVTFAEQYSQEALKSSGNAMRGGGSSSEYTELINLINKHMRPEEKEIYNYYVGKGNTTRANEYLEEIIEELKKREGGKLAEQANNNASEYIMSTLAGAQTGFQGIGNFVKGIEGEEGYKPTPVQYAHDEMRQDNTGARMVFNDLAYSTGNMMPAIAAGALATGLTLNPEVGRIVGSAVTGISSSGNSYADMIEQGYGVDQARKYGVMVGAAEGGLSYLFSGISQVGGNVTGNVIGKAIDGVDNGIARFFVDFAIKSSSEAIEEGAQSILEPVFKMIATGEDFEGIDWSEVAYSALLGALSAGTLEGVPNAVKGVHQNYKSNVAHGGLSNTDAVKAFWENKSFKDVKSAYNAGKQAVTGSASAYVDEALEIDPSNEHAQRMKARLDAGKNVSGYQINRLSEATESAIYEQDESKIKNAILKQLGDLGEKTDVTPIAEVLTKYALGEKLSSQDYNILNNSQHGYEVLNGLNPQNIVSGSLSNNWAEKIGTKRVNPVAYNKEGYNLTVREAREKLSVAKTLAESKNATGAKFETSESGKTIYNKADGTTEAVTVKGIASTKGGLKVELDNGDVVSASDLSFSSKEEALMYEMVARMDVSPETANEFITTFKPSNLNQASLYFNNVSLAYKYGSINYEKGLKNINLTEQEKRIAYNRGKMDAIAKAKENTKTAPNAVKADGKKTNKSGIIYEDGFTYDESTANELQKVSMAHIEVIDKMSNLEVHVYASKMENGKRVAYVNGKKVKAPNGYFKDGNKIYIDFYAGKNAEGAMLYTMSHEVTHYIRKWNEKGFKELGDFLIEQYGKKGVPVNALIEAQKDTIKKRYKEEGKTLPGEAKLFDMAYEELVADAMSDMFTDPKAYEKLIKLKQKNHSLWQKLGEAIKAILDKFKSALGIYRTEDVPVARAAFEARSFSADVYEKLQDLYIKAFVEADANYASAEKTLYDSGISVDSETESATLMSVRDVLDSEQQQEVSKALATRFGVTQKEAMQWLTAETSLASLILNPKYSQYLDYTADAGEEAIKSNSDYPQGTVDFSNICKKRRDFTEVMNRVLRNFPNHVFEATDLAKIRTIMMEEGMEVACGICYVEDRRQLDSVVAQDFINSLELYRKGSKTRPDGKAFNTNQLKALKLIEGDSYTPSIYELISLEGRNVLKAKNPAMEEAWVKFNNARGMQSVRLLLNDAEYKRQILKYKPDTVKRKNDLGGLRIYSFSDAEMFHLIDIIQVITDSATVGLSLQGYTKVNEYAKAVKDTGEKLNRSLIPKGDLGYHIEDGKVVLDFDTVEGIDINHPDFFDNIDNPNVGNILIGINKTQIKAAMVSKFVDQIIPFHTGQSNEVLGEKGISAWANYKDFQSERDIATGKKSSHQINIYTEVIQAAEKEGKPITNKVEFVNKFLEVCKENNLEPRFSEFLNVDENGNYTYAEGYHKFLVDFKTFDQNTGEYLPQMPVKPIFDNEYITGLLEDYVKSQKTKDAELSKAMPKVLDRITKEIVNSSETKFSDRDSDYMDALNRGDMETAQKMVDEAAKEAGYTAKVYHGTNQMGFTVFDPKYSDDKISLFFSDNPKVAKTYSSKYAKVRPTSSFPTMKSFKYERGKKYTEEEMREAHNFIQSISYVYGIPKFNVEKQTMYHAGTRYSAKQLMELADYYSRAGIYEVFVNPDGMMEVDANRHNWNSIPNPNGVEYKYKINYQGEGFNYFNAKADDTFTLELYKNGEVEYNGTITFSELMPVLRERFGENRAEMAVRHATDGSGMGSKYYENIETSKKYLTTRELSKQAKKDGYKGLIIKNVYDNGGSWLPYMGDNPSNLYILFDSNQVKSADSVTYDDNGKVIPLSERFKSENSDIRYADRDSYAPTFYSHMGKVIEGIKLNKMGANGVVSYLKGKGVKDEEIKWSGIEAFLEGKKSVTKAELQEFVAGSQLQIEEEMSGAEAFDIIQEGEDYIVKDKNGNVLDTWERTQAPDDPELMGWISLEEGDIVSTVEEIREYTSDWYGDGGARWSQYRLDGGTNYRELVFKLPNSTYSNRAMRAHWGQDAEGVLAHARIQDMTTADGKRMLFIEELQSDWHNEGHQKGYTTKEYEDAVAVYDRLAEDYANKRRAFNKYVRSGEFRSDPDEVSKKKFDWLRRKMDDAEKRMQTAERDIEALKAKGMGDVPDAPFRNNYHEYVLKRLLRMAAEEGYDSIGWTIADTQSKRWSYDYEKAYKIEYDQDIPKFLRKYGKQWGAKVGKERIGEYTAQFEVDLDTMTDSDELLLEEGVKFDGTEIWSMSIPDSMKDSVLHEGQVLYDDRDSSNDYLTEYAVQAALYDSLDHPDKGDDNLIRISRMPRYIVDLLGIDGDFYIYRNHAYENTVSEEQAKADGRFNPKAHYHNLGIENMTDAVMSLNNPIMTLATKSREGNPTVIMLLPVFGQNNAPLYAVLSFYANKPINGDFARKPHVVLTIAERNFFDDTGRAGLSDVVKSAISEGRVLDFDKKRREDLSVIAKSAGLGNITEASLKESLTHFRKFVKTFREENNITYSDRDTEVVSNRTILANALESIAQNDIEKNKLTQYKKKIALIESEQKKLAELRAKIKDLSFAKGARDTEAIKKLQFEANQTANRINTYDKQLLDLESTTSLKGVLEREKAMLRKKLEQKGKQALKDQKQKDAATVRELLTRYQDSRQKAIEGRHKTEMRHKIKDVVSKLNSLLLNPTKDQHVPIGLQKVVADALDAINMDTMNAEERVAYYNDLISKSTDPDEIAMLTKKRDFFEYRDMNFKDRITALKNAYAEFKESDDPLIRNAHNDAIEDLIKNTADAVGNKSLKDMSLSQLESVYDMYKAILATVRNSNKMFKEGRQATITENSEAVKTEVKEVGGHHDRIRKATKGIKSFTWNLLKPIYALQRIGSKTLTSLFDNVRAGEETYAVDIYEAREFFQDKSKAYNYDSWDFKKRYNFKDSAGNDFALSLDQILSLYAYSKREQADKHLEFGGFVFDDVIEVTEKNKLGIPVKYEVNDATPYRLRVEDLTTVINSLTTEQKGFVDDMQTYLSEVMGAKGNEITLAMYDIKMFKEKHYFPLKTSRYFREYNPEQVGNPMLRNSGFTKKTVPKAGNPIVLSNFMDVWTSHVNDMSMYHSFVLPLEDFMRVYNYSSTAGGYDSVQQYIKNAYGAEANQYIEKLMQDINGGVISGNIQNGWLKMFGKFKKAAVAASLSTIVQQPTAVIRAMAIINPKYFVGIPFKGGHKKIWQEIKNYAPVAIIKEMGGFDVGSGRQAKDFITSQTYKGLGKIKGFFTDSSYRDSIFMWGATKADELGWNSIWKAVKREVASKQNLKPGTEEFFKACGKRFTEVVTQTQVYDSVFARSGIMRDKGDLNKFATSFMGEPTTSFNMIYNAILKAKRGGSKAQTVREISSVYVSIVGAAALASLIYGLRDDDEDEAYLEKWAEAFGNKLSSEIWIHNMIPYIRDIASILEGWDVERPDMSIFSDIKSSFDQLFKINDDGEFEWKVDFSDPKSVYGAIENFGGSIASAFGLPLKNLMRDTRGIFNGFKHAFDDIHPEDVGGAFVEGFTGEEKGKSDLLYEAIINGDKGRLKIYREGYKTEDSFETAVRKALRENDSRIHEAAQARLDGDISEYTRIAKEIIAEGNFSQDTVVGAINSEISAIKKGESTEEKPTEGKDEATSIYKASDINAAFESGDKNTALKIIDDLIETKVANGKTEKEAKSSVRSSMTSYWKPLYKEAYRSGDYTEMARIREILLASGLYGSANEVVKTGQSWLKD